MDHIAVSDSGTRLAPAGGRRLIVNADGFGFGLGATQGIVDALREGEFISSISVNANFPMIEQLPAVAAEFPALSIGVHLNPLVGRPCLPCSEVPSLVDGQGMFRNHEFFRLIHFGRISKQQLEAELDAQIKRVVGLVGHRVTHLDSQANCHLSFLQTFIGLAKKWRLPRMRCNSSLICLEAEKPSITRRRVYSRKPHTWMAHLYRRHQMRVARQRGMRMPDRLITVGYAGLGNKTSAQNWVRILSNLPRGTFELYCHPAYPDETLRQWSSYLEERRQELEILRARDLKEMAARLGIAIIPFSSI